MAAPLTFNLKIVIHMVQVKLYIMHQLYNLVGALVAQFLIKDPCYFGAERFGDVDAWLCCP